MLLNYSCHAVVATSKKNACVSLVFSFLYKVVQVSRAPGAPKGCGSPDLLCASPYQPFKSYRGAPAAPCMGFVIVSPPLFHPPPRPPVRKVNRRRWGSGHGCPLALGGASMPPSWLWKGRG